MSDLDKLYKLTINILNYRDNGKLHFYNGRDYSSFIITFDNSVDHDDTLTASFNGDGGVQLNLYIDGSRIIITDKSPSKISWIIEGIQEIADAEQKEVLLRGIE